MITLLTGVPGAGKTCYLIGELLRESKDGRPLFIHGIPDLKIDHTPVFCTADSCRYCQNEKPKDGEYLLAEEWDKWAPDGAVLAFDEVQNIYRPRRQGMTAPSSVMAFETHRHSGLDFYILSQSPMLFDSNVRRLVGKHIHLRSSWSGRRSYEFPEVQENTKSTAGGVESKYKLDKKNFLLYKSAELHTKPTRKVPAMVYALVGVLLLIGFLGYRTYDSIGSKIAGESPALDQLPINRNSQLFARNGDVALYPEKFDYSPVIQNMPETAPAFADLVEVVSFPRVSACVHLTVSGVCNCYTQQGTLADVEYEYCRNYVRKRPFNPYKPDLQPERESLRDR